MKDTPWFKALIGGTYYRMFSRHLRWMRPAKPENENERRKA